jgi:hypothetical protein
MNDKQQSALDKFFEAMPQMAPDLGCNIGAGWQPTVLDALIKLHALSASTGIAIQPRQIKEKFGNLRMYLDVGEDSIDDIVELESAESHIRLGPKATLGSVREQAYAIVRDAERITGELCETCGTTAPTMSNLGGYICRRCPACIAARQTGVQS